MLVTLAEQREKVAESAQRAQTSAKGCWSCKTLYYWHYYIEMV